MINYCGTVHLLQPTSFFLSAAVAIKFARSSISLLESYAGKRKETCAVKEKLVGIKKLCVGTVSTCEALVREMLTAHLCIESFISLIASSLSLSLSDLSAVLSLDVFSPSFLLDFFSGD